MVEPVSRQRRHVHTAVTAILQAARWCEVQRLAARTKDLAPGGVVDVEATSAKEQRIVDMFCCVIVRRANWPGRVECDIGGLAHHLIDAGRGAQMFAPCSDGRREEQ